MDAKSFLEILVTDAILVTAGVVTPPASLPTTDAIQVQASLHCGERYDDTHIEAFGRIQNLRNGVSVYGYINNKILANKTFAQFATPIFITISEKQA